MSSHPVSGYFNDLAHIGDASDDSSHHTQDRAAPPSPQPAAWPLASVQMLSTMSKRSTDTFHSLGDTTAPCDAPAQPTPGVWQLFWVCLQWMPKLARIH